MRVLDSLVYSEMGLDGCSGYEMIEGDVLDHHTLDQALEGVSAIAHLAGTSGDPSCDLDPKACLNDNLLATRLLVEMAKERGIERMAFASSCSIYGAQDDTVGEEDRPNPLTLYAETKYDAESAVGTLRGGVSLRLSTLFGLSGRTRCDLVVNLLTCHAVTKGRIMLFGGEQWRPLLHVKDAAAAFGIALERPLDDTHNLYNVGGNHQNLRVFEIADVIQEVVPTVTIDVHPVDRDARTYRVDFSRIERCWGFKPSITVAEGAIEVCNALQSGMISDWRAPHYSTRGRIL